MEEVEAFLQNVDAVQRVQLQRVREVIQKHCPEATECISYAMPSFKYKGKYLISYCGFKNHMSVFPGAEAIATLGQRLEGYKIAKGTVQFTVEKPLTDELITALVDQRVSAIIGA